MLFLTEVFYLVCNWWLARCFLPVVAETSFITVWNENRVWKYQSEGRCKDCKRLTVSFVLCDVHQNWNGLLLSSLFGSSHQNALIWFHRGLHGYFSTPKAPPRFGYSVLPKEELIFKWASALFFHVQWHWSEGIFVRYVSTLGMPKQAFWNENTTFWSCDNFQQT